TVHGRGVEVSIVFDSIENATGPKGENVDAINASHIAAITIPRTHGTLMHNKFLVLSDENGPVALLFGSTNLTENGIFGHANCVHIIEGAEPAADYLTYFEALTGDPLTTRASTYKADNVTRSPAPVQLDEHSLAPVFSPRPDIDAL